MQEVQPLWQCLTTSTLYNHSCGVTIVAPAPAWHMLHVLGKLCRCIAADVLSCCCTLDTGRGCYHRASCRYLHTADVASVKACDMHVTSHMLRHMQACACVSGNVAAPADQQESLHSGSLATRSAIDFDGSSHLWALPPVCVTPGLLLHVTSQLHLYSDPVVF